MRKIATAFGVGSLAVIAVTAGGVMLVAADSTAGDGDMRQMQDVEPVLRDFEERTGHALPTGATDVATHWERGIDVLSVIHFTAPTVEAEAFARAVLGDAPLRETGDPWKHFQVPEGIPTPSTEGFQSGDVTRFEQGYSVFVDLAPPEDGRQGVWVTLTTM